MDLEDYSKNLKSSFDSPTFGKDGLLRLDKPVGSASISPCGRDIVLASRVGLHIVDLDSPYSPPRYLSHHTPWEVADVQWSPFASRDSWVVSTSNQKALIWNLEMRDPRSSIEHVLHAHTRAITDINFSAHHPDVLATCGVDSFVHCWDIRRPRRPAISFCDWFAGATQVKWNRQDSHIIASSHDKMLRIWDDRKGAYPLRSIEAHTTKIYGVDWDRVEPRNLVTCSLDRTIKFWDYGNTVDKPQKIISTDFPVWRARHTPFGSGLLAMPQRGDSNLYLYDYHSLEGNHVGNMTPAVYHFGGHHDRVKEFLWRPRGTIEDGVDNREFQLVSWGNDKKLRLHQITEDVLNKVGYQKGQIAKPNINLTRKNADYKTFRDSPSKPRFDTSDPGFGMSKGLRVERYSQHGGPARSMTVTKNRNSTDMDPIAWMKGVKIGKRETLPSDTYQAFSSMLSPLLASDRAGETFDSLGEEITHVGQRFRKVGFNEIDMLNRVVVLGLMGPWSPTGTSTWMKCRFHFPDGYPDAAEPVFAILESPSLTDEKIRHISSEVQWILKAYLARQLSSLQAIVLYLLGERDLEQSLLWLAKIPDGELNVPHNSSESSSDEEDQLEDGHSGIDHNQFVASNVQYNVPLPKACGALWADDGRLVCFFPRRPEKADPFVTKLKSKAGSQTGIFERFGHLNPDLMAPRRPRMADLSESENSDSDYLSSSSESSSSSQSSGHLFVPSMAWHSGTFEGPRDPSVDESYRSSGAVGDSYLGSNSNYIAIHACHDLLPSKKTLARDYMLSKDHQMCCLNNSRVAAESGAQDIADVWSLVAVMIRKEVPMEIIQHPHKGETILAAARRVAHPLRTRDSAIDLSFDLTEDLPEAQSVKWGGHPFGNKWLVDSIFEYFEALADVQMLAMLSCVLSEPCGSRASTSRFHDQWQTSIDTETTAIESYYPSAELARELFGIRPKEIQVETQPNKIPAANFAGPSVASPQKELSAFVPLQIPLTTSDSANGIGSEHQGYQSTSLSTSPEYLRHVPRSNSGLAGAFAASLSRPFSFATSASSSPPTQPKKRLSPAVSYLGAASGGNWHGPHNITKPSTIPGGSRPANSLSVSDAEEDKDLSRTPTFKTKLKNQQDFSEDGYANIPLLDPKENQRHKTYRDAYAHMLYVWGMPIAMCEVLKYNTEFSRNFVHSNKGSSELAIGRNTSSDVETPQGLLLRDTCLTCNAFLASAADGSVCRTCSAPRTSLVCLLCTSIIRGLASPCLSCGHVLHPACRALLSAYQSSDDPSIDDDDEIETCVSGCGCRCAEHTVVEVEEPQCQPRKSSDDAVTVIADESAASGPQDRSDGKGEHAWQDVVYESLARNLGGRTLTPRSSQIWRGGDGDFSRNRKKSVGSNLKNEESFG